MGKPKTKKEQETQRTHGGESQLSPRQKVLTKKKHKKTFAETPFQKERSRRFFFALCIEKQVG